MAIRSRFTKESSEFSFIRRKIHMESKKEDKAQENVAQIPPVVATFRQALLTFPSLNKQDQAFMSNIVKLKSMMNAMRIEDFNFDMSFMNPEIWQSKTKAPCTYIQVFQNKEVNLSIFILKPGYKMPLHDHPQMYGLLKVILGAVNIRSYTEYPVTTAPGATDAEIEKLAKIEAQRLVSGNAKKRTFFASVTQDEVHTKLTDACVLTPTASNYHEIEALNVPSAFFDILSPPYDTFSKEIGPRRCRYYQVAKQISANVVILEEKDAPIEYFCDQAPYKGPTLIDKTDNE